MAMGCWFIRLAGMQLIAFYLHSREGGLPATVAIVAPAKVVAMQEFARSLEVSHAYGFRKDALLVVQLAPASVRILVGQVPTTKAYVTRL